MLAASAAVCAQAYPSRPVTFIVPFPPGGGTDISARTVATKLTATWAAKGQPGVVAENRSGAAGILGANAVAQAKPDGYTLLIVNVGMTSINPALYAKLPYDHEKAFVPVSSFVETTTSRPGSARSSSNPSSANLSVTNTRYGTTTTPRLRLQGEPRACLQRTGVPCPSGNQ